LSHNLFPNLKQDQGKIVNKIWRGRQDIACEYVISLYILSSSNFVVSLQHYTMRFFSY